MRRGRRLRSIRRFPKLKKLIKIGLWSFLIIIILSISHIIKGWILSLDEFRVKNLNIYGDYPKKEEIRREFEEHCLERYGERRPNIFKIDLRALKEKLEKIPRVKGVEIRKRLPHTLYIEVKRRSPIALIPLDDGSFLGCDEEGVFDIDLGKRYDLPFITGSTKEGIEKAVRIIDGIRKNTPSLLQRLSEVNASSPKDLYLYTMDGTKVLFGDIERYRFETRLRKLLLLLDYIERKGLPQEYIDLRFDHIVIKPKG